MTKESTVTSVALPAVWIEVTQQADMMSKVVFCKFQGIEVPSVSHSLCIHSDFHWQFVCHGKPVSQATCPLVARLPSTLESVSDIEGTLALLNDARLCEGNADEKFLPLAKTRKGRFMDSSGTSYVIVTLAL